MRPGQLVECNLKNNFLEKLYTKCDGETIARPLSKKNQNWAYLWINILKFYMVFLVWQVEDYRKWLKLSCSSLTFTSYKTSLRNKRWPETSLYASFSARFLKKKISLLLYSFARPNLNVWLPLVCEIFGKLGILVVYYPGCDVIHFEINPFSYITKKSRQKFKYT